jgi:hypothetical protein
MVQSADGKYLRSTGYGGGGKHWVDELEKGKIWIKKGQALSQITRWKNMYPDIPTAKLVILSAEISEIVDQTDRVEETIIKIKTRELERKKVLLERYYSGKEKELEEVKRILEALRGES